MTFKTKKQLKFFDGFLLFWNLIIGIILILSYWAPVTDPQKTWLIAMLGLTYPFLLILNLFFVFYWLIRFWLYAIISALCILCGINVITESLRFHNAGADKRKSPSDIRMMAYNIRGFIGATPAKQTIDEIIGLIDQQQPDIINLEEFAINVNDQQKIYALLKKDMSPGYHYFKPYDFTPYDSSGVAIYSKYPIINKGQIFSDADTLKAQSIFVDLKTHGQILRVYCLHLQSTHLNDNDHAYLKKLTRRGEVSLHQIISVEQKLRQAFIYRSYQVAVIKKHMELCPYPYIVAGDFNDTPNSFAVNTIGKGLKNAFIQKGNGLGITYFGDFPNVHIDYIFTSPQFDIINYRRIEKKLSDHYPIVSDLRLGGQ